MKNRVLLGFLLLAPFAVYPLDYTVLQTVFVPPKYFIGDSVELRIRLKTKEGVSVAVPDKLPESSWINFNSITVVDKGDEKEVRISFSSYLVGTQTLPAVTVGDVVFRDIKIHTDSLLSEGREEFRGPRGQVLLPGTRLFFALTALLVTGAGFLLFVAVGFGRKRIRIFSEMYHDGIPYRRLKKAIRRLRGENENLKARDFYITLLDEIRSYVSGKLGHNCVSATTQEIKDYLHERFPDSPAGFPAVIVSLFRQGDRVKFAHETIPASKRLESLDRLQDAAAAIEKELRKKVSNHVDV